MDWGVVGTEAVTGLGLGASIGSLFPGFGTVIGAGVGLLAGGIYGLASSDTEDQAQKKLWERGNIMGISQNAPTSLLGRQSGAYAKNKIQHRKTVNESALDTINATRQTRDIVNYGAAAGSLVAGGIGATGLVGAGTGAASSAAATVPAATTAGTTAASTMGPAGTAIMGVAGGSSAPIAATAGVSGNAILTAANAVTPLTTALASLTKDVVPSLVSGVQGLSPDANKGLTKEKLYADENIQDPDKEDPNKTDINNIYNNIGTKYPSFLEPQQRFDSLMDPKNNSLINARLADGGENTGGPQDVIAGEAGREWLIDSKTGDIIKELNRGAERLSMPEGTAVINQRQKVRLEAGEPLESIINQLPDVKDVDMATLGTTNPPNSYTAKGLLDPRIDEALAYYNRKMSNKADMDRILGINDPERNKGFNHSIRGGQLYSPEAPVGAGTNRPTNWPDLVRFRSMILDKYDGDVGRYEADQYYNSMGGRVRSYKYDVESATPSGTNATVLWDQNPIASDTPKAGEPGYTTYPSVTEPHVIGAREPLMGLTKVPTRGLSPTAPSLASLVTPEEMKASITAPPKTIKNANANTPPPEDEFSIGANELGLAGNLMNQFLAAVQPRAEEYKVPKVNLGEPVFASAEKINPDNYRDDRDVMSLIQTMRENGMSLASIGPALLQRDQERNRTIAGQNLQAGNQVRMENARIGNEYTMKKAEMDVSHTAQQAEADKQVAMIRGAQDSARMSAAGNSLFSAEQYLSKKKQDVLDEEMRRAVLYDIYHGKR